VLQAALAGHPVAQHELGMALLLGNSSLGRNLTEAFETLDQCAGSGHAACQWVSDPSAECVCVLLERVLMERDGSLQTLT
jgi:hypothetical protein